MMATIFALRPLLEVMKMKIKKAVIPAAGFGTRFLPITKVMAKELLPIIDRPALEYIVKEAVSAGISEILIIISPHKDEIKNYFETNHVLEEFLTERGNFEALKLINEFANIKIEYVIQYEQLGLGHAVLHAKDFVKDEPFAVLLGDDLFYSEDKPAIKELIDRYEQIDGHIIGTMNVLDSETSKYGICDPIANQVGPVFELKGFVEKPQPQDAPSRSASCGRYILHPVIFEYLEKQTRGIGNEIQLTDAILKSMEKIKIYSYDIAAKRYDIGSKEGYLKAIVEIALKRADLKEAMQQIIKDNQ